MRHSRLRRYFKDKSTDVAPAPRTRWAFSSAAFNEAAITLSIRCRARRAMYGPVFETDHLGKGGGAAVLNMCSDRNVAIVPRVRY